MAWRLRPRCPQGPRRRSSRTAGPGSGCTCDATGTGCRGSPRRRPRCGGRSSVDAREGGARAPAVVSRRPHIFWLMRRVPAVSARCQGSPREERRPCRLPRQHALLLRGDPWPPPGSPHRDQRPAVEGTVAPLLGKAGSPVALQGPLLPTDADSLPDPTDASATASGPSQDPGWAVFPASRRCSKVLAGLSAATGPLSCCKEVRGTASYFLPPEVWAGPRSAHHESVPDRWFSLHPSGSWRVSVLPGQSWFLCQSPCWSPQPL